MSSPSEVLLAAADRIRDLAAKTTTPRKGARPGWYYLDEDDGIEPGGRTTVGATGYGGDDIVAQLVGWDDARWIAALSPALAPALEGWLREMAAVSARVADMDLTAADGSLMRHALNLAESILGSGVDTHG